MCVGGGATRAGEGGCEHAARSPVQRSAQHAALAATTCARMRKASIDSVFLLHTFCLPSRSSLISCSLAIAASTSACVAVVSSTERREQGEEKKFGGLVLQPSLCLSLSFHLSLTPTRVPLPQPRRDRYDPRQSLIRSRPLHHTLSALPSLAEALSERTTSPCFAAAACRSLMACSSASVAILSCLCVDADAIDQSKQPGWGLCVDVFIDCRSISIRCVDRVWFFCPSPSQ